MAVWSAGERAQAETRLAGAPQWRSKIGAPPANAGRSWHQPATRSRAAPPWQGVRAGKADALRQQSLRRRASHLAHGAIRHRQTCPNQGHTAQHRWPHRFDGAIGQSRGPQAPRISIADRTPVQDWRRKESPHFFRNCCGVAVNRAAAVRLLNSCSYSLSRRSHSQAMSTVSAFSNFA